MTRSDRLATADTQPVLAYETLRTAVLCGQSHGQGGLGIIVHRGLAAWLGEIKAAELLVTTPAQRARAAPSSMPVPGELSRLLADIILVLTTENVHAHG